MTDLSASLIEANAIEVNRENIKQISDDVLFKKLKVCNLNPGPIMPSTRGIYEKKLLNFLENNQSVNMADQTIDRSESAKVVVESLRHDGNLSELMSKTKNIVNTDSQANLNDSFDSYTKQISSIRSRAPLRTETNEKSNNTSTQHIIHKSKGSSASNVLVVVSAFLIILALFVYYFRTYF